MDEIWDHLFQPKTKQQSKQWKHLGSLPSKEVKTWMSAGKVMGSSVWDAKGVLLVAYYADLLRQLQEKIKLICHGKRTR